MKQSKFKFIAIVLMSMIGESAFAYDIEVKNDDGVTIIYDWTSDGKSNLIVTRKWMAGNEYSGSVVIPSSVYYDGKYHSVTGIEEKAFCNCSNLTSVTIPNSVTSIGKEAFVNCPNLLAISLPTSVTTIGNDAFKETGWYNNQSDGLVYAGKVAYKYKGTMPENTKLTIKAGTLGIADNAFQGCTGLTSVTLPNSLISIGNNAFYSCNNLKTIVSEISNPYEIENSVFSTSSYNTDIYNTAMLIVPVSTKAAYQSATGWSSFKNIAETGDGGAVGATIDVDGVFFIIGENNTASITSNSSKYSGNFEIKSQVTYNGKTYKVTSVNKSAFYKCSDLTSVTIPSSITSIGDDAFEYCSSLIFVLIPNSVTSIGSSAFYQCSSLTSVIIGSGVVTIGSSAFANTNLKKVIWLTNTPPSGYGDVSSAVHYVSNDQFSFYNQVQYKYQFLSSYFDVDGVRYVPVSPSERTCDAIDCVYDESATNTKIASTVAYKGVTMNVKNIMPYLAYNNKYIKTLSLDHDGDIADYTFTDCSNMETVTHGDKIHRIGKGAFSGCSSLTSLTTTEKVSLSHVLCISKYVNTVDDYAFKGCTAIQNLIFQDSEEELTLGANYIDTGYYSSGTGTPLFSDCPLDSVYIGRNIEYNTSKSHGYSPFYRNLSLRAVKITDRETEVSENEFYGCTNLQRVVIGDGVTTIENWAFSGCSSLKFFAFGTQVATIGQEAFSDCTAVIEISSKAQAAPVCGTQALDDIRKWECKLYVPDGCMALYQAADQWKEFFFTEEGQGSASQSGSGGITVKKCETPTIAITGDKLNFACKTEGVVYHYTITHSDVRNGVSDKDVNLTSTYNITVFASKEGYNDSEVATTTIKASGSSGVFGDLTGDGKVNVADHVKLSQIIMGTSPK